MKRKDAMPNIVYIGLLGVNSRKAAYTYTILCIAIAIVCLICSFFHPMFFLGSFSIGGAYWYYHCIKWVDTHSSWNA